MNGKSKEQKQIHSNNKSHSAPKNGKEILDIYNQYTSSHAESHGGISKGAIRNSQKDLEISRERSLAPPKTRVLVGAKSGRGNVGNIRVSNPSTFIGNSKGTGTRLAKSLRGPETRLKTSFKSKTPYNLQHPVADLSLHKMIGKHLMLSNMRSNSGVPVAFDAQREDIPVIATHTETRHDKHNGLVGIVEGSDFCVELTVDSSTGPGDILYTQALNPHALVRSRLNNQSLNWQKFRFEKLEFVFISAQGTDGDGQIVSTIFTDPLDELTSESGASNIEEALANFGNVAISNIWEQFKIEFEDESAEADLFTDETMSSDKRLTSNGVFQVISNSPFTSSLTLGMIYMNYKVHFSQPTLPSGQSIVVGSAWSHLALNAGNPTDGSPFGDSSNPPPLVPFDPSSIRNDLQIEPVFVDELGGWAWYLPRGHWKVSWSHVTASTPSPTPNLILISGSNIVVPTFATELFAIGSNTSGINTFARSSTEYITSMYVQCILDNGQDNYIQPVVSAKVGGGSDYSLIAISGTHPWNTLPFLDTFQSEKGRRDEDSRINVLEKEISEIRGNYSKFPKYK